MHANFAAVLESLHPLFLQLIAMTPLKGTAPVPIETPRSGVYLFSESDCHLYVGRSNRIAARYLLHCSPGAQHNQASFAWKLMAEAVGHKPTYRKGQGRADLILLPNYAEAFNNAKDRIRKMDFRFVEVTDQKRQALLELYASIALGTRYNDFNTH